jgi:hypothetical protein
MQLIIKIFMEKPLGIFKTLAKNLKKKTEINQSSSATPFVAMVQYSSLSARGTTIDTGARGQ